MRRSHIRVWWWSLWCGGLTSALNFAEDVQHDHAANVNETDQHDGLGGELEASGVLAEAGELVALSVGAALLLREGCASVLGLTAGLRRSLCSFFCR